jgi:prevent-host-death family protein
MPAKAKKSIQEISVSEFKAKCLSLLQQVQKTKSPIRVTKRGKPIAEIVPVSPQSDARRDWIGSLSAVTKITGDIVSPVIDLQDFEVYRD